MCESCKNGYDGTNGNGYQPCGCGSKPIKLSEFVAKDSQTIDESPVIDAKLLVLVFIFIGVVGLISLCLSK